MKTWGWPDEPSQTLTKASDSMAQDCVRGGWRVTVSSRGGGARGRSSLFASGAARETAAAAAAAGRGVSCARARFTASRCLSGAARAAADARRAKDSGKGAEMFLWVTRVAHPKLDGIGRHAEAREVEHLAKRKRNLLSHGISSRLILCWRSRVGGWVEAKRLPPRGLAWQ